MNKAGRQGLCSVGNSVTVSKRNILLLKGLFRDPRG